MRSPRGPITKTILDNNTVAGGRLIGLYRALKGGMTLLFSLSCLHAGSEAGSLSLRPRITFDFSSLRTLYLRPESVLADVEGFWREDRAYWLTACWHKDVGYPVPPSGWIDAIKTLAKLPEGEREAHPIMRQLRSLESKKDQFLDTALPLLASLLPQAGCDLSTTVFFTSAIVPNAFQKNFNIVLNVAAADPSNRENGIFNTIVHELFHVGYYGCECLMKEIPLNGAEEYDLVYSLQNEGLATYAGYLASKEYPADVFRDYARLDALPDVIKAIGQVNSLMAGAADRPADAFRKDLFQVGVQQRSLYLAGAFMARTIDEKLGRRVLASSMETGPRSFISIYDSLVDDPLKISGRPLAEPPTLCQRMRKAAVAEDYGELTEILKAMGAGTAEAVLPAGHIMHNTGQLLLRRQKYELARRVYEVYRRFAPKHVNPYEGLGDACRQLGDLDNAMKNYEEVLRLSPGHVRVLEILKELKNKSNPIIPLRSEAFFHDPIDHSPEYEFLNEYHAYQGNNHGRKRESGLKDTMKK